MTNVAGGGPLALEAYLKDGYVSLDEISSRTKLSTVILESLIEARCMPGPSYEIRERKEIYAFVNDEVDTLSLETTAQYFARDVIGWVAALEPRLRRLSPADLAPILKSEMREEFETGLSEHGASEIEYGGFVASTGYIDGTGFDRYFEEYIWPHWYNGTWGICVRGSDSMKNIARKTVAVNLLKKLTDDGTKTVYSTDETGPVRAAIAEYEAIVPPFSPHDRHESSRARLVEPTLMILDGR